MVYLFGVGALVALSSGKAFAHEDHAPTSDAFWDIAIEDQKSVQKATCWHLMSEINDSLLYTVHQKPAQVSKPTLELIEAYKGFCKRD